MKVKILSIALIIFTLFSCSNSETSTQQSNQNKVLLLKVDYNTNTFETGKEMSFATLSPTMTVTNQYTPPGDFGSIKLNYQELNQTLFDGTIVWNGTGEMTYPNDLVDESQFEKVLTTDYVTPNAGFENVFNPNNTTYDYLPIWTSVQNLVKVREYLTSNPNATVKIFLYTPSVGIGNPEEWDWIVMLKN